MAGTAASRSGGVDLTTILELSSRLARLDDAARKRADRLIEVELITGRTDPPPSMEPWLIRTFGSVAAVREQRLVRVTNRATLESAVLATLRTRRPMESNGRDRPADLRAEIEGSAPDPFCDPAAETPADTFGRVRGRRMVTGANAALADAFHAVIVFDEHDPLAFDVDLVADLLDTGRAWAERARSADPDATHYLLAWNCLWRAGGSIIHGHAQAMAGHRPPARLARFRRAIEGYAATTGGDLVADLVAVHGDLGLAAGQPGTVVTLAHLVPTKEREVLVIGGPGMDERDPAFAGAVGRAVVALRDRAAVRSFNLALWRPALDSDDPMPPIVRIVDRGDPALRPSDIGAMELFGTPIVGSDPYELLDVLRDGL